DRLVQTVFDFAAVELALQRRQQRLVDERGLAGAGDAGHADQAAQRDAHVDVLEVVFAAAFQLERGDVRIDGTTRLGRNDGVFAGQVLEGDGVGVGEWIR